MPVVDKNQLKIWFKNLAKPVQEQFWNWMDSFYHKSEPIPKSAVENLTTDLAKKADLVGGVVPASQLPFSVNTSEVIAVGEISATENTVTLSVHSSGTNAVRINGVVLTRTFPNTFNFTPVTEGSKFLIIYAINDSGIFRLAEGVEDLEAVEPEIPVGALFVRRILINSAGADVELPTLTGFKEKKEDNWKVFLFSQTDAPVFLPFSDGRTSFLLLSQNSLAGNLILGGFARGQADANWWSGKELTILNNTGSNVSLQNMAGFDELTQATFRANYVLKNNEAVKVKVLQDGDLLEVMAVSIDISGKLDKGGYTGTAQDLKNEIDGKLNKPTTTSTTASYPYVVGEDGNGNSARLPAGDLGKNFFNSDLSNTTARNHTMNAGITIKTLGNPHILSGLPNKNADIANFRKVRVQNTSGLDAVVDSKNLLTDGMTSMTDAEKDAWRLAQRKTGENYSTGQPRVDFILPFKLAKNIDGIQYFSCIGSNLLLNLSDFQVKLINTGTGVEYPVSVVNTSASTTSQFSIGYGISTLPTGTYRVYVRNGLNVNIDTTTFDVVDNISYSDLSYITWQKNVLTSGDFTGSTAIGGNINRQSPNITGEPSTNVRKIEFLSSEILNALEANGNFIIEINFSRYRADVHNNSYLGLVDSSVNSLNGSGQIMFGWASLSGGGNRTTLFPTSTTAGGGSNLGQESGKMIISKKGSIIQMMAILSGNIYITTNISQTNSYTGLKLMYFDYGINSATSGAQQTYNIKLYK